MIVAVIPTLTRPPTLKPLLENLKADGVEVVLIDTKGQAPDCYRWWNEGTRKARELGATEIAVLNDDIRLPAGALSFMARALRSDPEVALVSPELNTWSRSGPAMQVPDKIVLRHSMGHGISMSEPAFVGWTFMFKAELPLPDFDESYRWYWGDQAFEEDVRKAGFKVAAVVGLVTEHLGSLASRQVGPRILEPLKKIDLQLWYDRHRKEHVSDGYIGITIPRVLHRMNIGGDPPEDATRYWEKFQELHPSWDMKLHGFPLDQKDWPETWWLWSWAIHPVQMADLLRYELLLREGGVYVDWDVEPYRSFDGLLGLEGFAGYETPGVVGSAVLGFRPQHPAVAKMLDIGMERCVEDHGHMMNVGPYTVTAAVEGRSDVVLFPPDTFFAANKVWHVRHLVEDGQFTDPWVYAVHRIHGSWLKDHPHLGKQANSEEGRPMVRSGSVIRRKSWVEQRDERLAMERALKA